MILYQKKNIALICLFVLNAGPKQRKALGQTESILRIRFNQGYQCARRNLEISVTRLAQVQRFAENAVHGSLCPETLSSRTVAAAWKQAKGQDSMHDPFLGRHFAKWFLPTYSCRVPHPVPGKAWSFLGIGNCTLTSLQANCFNASWMYLGYRPLTTGSSFIHRPEVP